MFEYVFAKIRDLDHEHIAHHLNVLDHTLLVLSFSEQSAVIRLVLLFHDVGKAEAKAFCEASNGYTLAMLLLVNYLDINMRKIHTYLDNYPVY